VHPSEAAELYQQFFIKDRYYKFYGTPGKGTPALRRIPVEHAITVDFSCEVSRQRALPGWDHTPKVTSVL
jgi:hypothetical protein